jgi:hypothetical protein
MLTEQEKLVLKLTADLWNEYMKLPETHISERSELQLFIHQIQHLIAVRVARRVDPEIWR